MITFQVLDDDVPELEEIFDVVIVSVTSDDGLVGSTNTSGASINMAAAIRNITVAETDNPHGLFQFSTGYAPNATDPLIPPATEKPMVIFPSSSL